jgi:hypothetical protein
MVIVLAQLTLWKRISHNFNCVTFVVCVCFVVTYDCDLWKIKNDVYNQLPKSSLPCNLANTF